MTPIVVPVASQVSVPLTVMLVVPCVMVDEERDAVNVHAYAGEREAAPIIVSTKIERTETAMNLNL
jgi:hypothetical protein